MVKLVTHKFVSTIPDGDDTSVVRPSNWNDTHDVSGVAESGANTDITSMSGITGGISSPDYIAFDTTYSTTLTAGQLGWDGNNTLAIGMAGGNVIQHIGEDSYFYYKATSAVTKGQVVMFTGAVGASGVPTGAPATGITDGTYIMGVAAESVALNGFGLVQAFGELRNVNTSGYADGDILWYDPSVTGGLTKTKPSAPNIKVQMAAVINGGSAGGGTILIRINPGSTLGGTDSNAQITSAANGNILTYDGTNGYWKNTDVASGTGVSVSKSATGVLTVTNTAPDQTVSLTAGTGISTSGTYPSFTVTNTAPDQVVSLTAGTNVTITGTYPSFTIAATGGGSTSPAGSNTQVQFNSSGSFGASANFTWDGTTMLATNVETTGGVLADGSFTGTYVDGIVMDYTSGAGRISVGGADSLDFYNGGVAGSLLGSINNTGDWKITRFLEVGNGTLITGATNPVLATAASANQYVQAYIHNDQAGTSSSADFTCYPDNGVDASGWVDMGITSSVYADSVYTCTGANEGYILMSAPSGSSTTGNLVYATDSTGSANAHQWYVGGFTQAKGAWKMQLTSSGLSLANALSIANGGTGQTTQTAAFDALSPTTTKGDLIAYNGSDNVRLAVGSDTQVLVADSTTATGLKWAAAGGFSGGTLTSSLTLAAGTTSLVPLDYQSGTLLTTPTAGGVEYDGKLAYFTPAGTSRALTLNSYYYRKNTSTVLTSATGNQSIFGLTSGVTLQASTLYEVEVEFELTTTGTTSHTEAFGFTLATATVSGMGVTINRLAQSTTSSALGGYLASVTPVVVTGALTTAQTVMYRVKGAIGISTGGSLNPVIAFSAAPGGTSTIVAGAWMKVTPIGTTGSNVSIGTWA